MNDRAKHIEVRFEDTIEIELLARGYHQGRSQKPMTASAGFFLLMSSPTSEPPRRRSGSRLSICRVSAAGAVLLDSLVKELAAKGALHVLRHGFKCFGKTYQMAAFRPASGMNPDTLEAYKQNILTITRQVPFNPATGETVDVVLSLNGIPVVTAELKNPMSGQTVENAKHQYANDRDPRTPLFRFKERALVHFAVDSDLVFMTTKIEGNSTQWLPFNRGYRNGAGNPPGESGNYRTAYLWETVLTRDSLLDILARYVHLQVEERQVRTPIRRSRRPQRSNDLPALPPADLGEEARRSRASHTAQVTTTSSSILPVRANRTPSLGLPITWRVCTTKTIRKSSIPLS